MTEAAPGSAMASTRDDGGRPLVSVIVPAYNASAYVGEAVASVFAQDYPNLELLVINDGSTDDTGAVLDALAAEHGERMTVVHTPNQGVSAARNELISRAGGEWIALLDADDIWLPGKLSAQMQAVAGRDEVGLCHSAFESFDDAGWTQINCQDPSYRFHGRCFDMIFKTNGVCPSTAVLRKSAIPACGFYTDMKIAEDYALWMHMMYTHEVVYIPSVTTRYRHHASQATPDQGRSTLIYRGLARLRFLAAHGESLDERTHRELREWTLEELRTCAYSRYWKGDYRRAAEAFKWLGDAGAPVARRHAWRARLGAWWGGGR